MKSENLEKIQKAIDENKKRIERAPIAVPFHPLRLTPFELILRFSPGFEVDYWDVISKAETIREDILRAICDLKGMDIPHMWGAILKWLEEPTARKADYWLRLEDELTQSLITHLNTIRRDYEPPSWKPSVRRGNNGTDA